MIKYFCNECGREIEGQGFSGRQLLITRSQATIYVTVDDEPQFVSDYHICDFCVLELLREKVNSDEAV